MTLPINLMIRIKDCFEDPRTTIISLMRKPGHVYNIHSGGAVAVRTCLKVLLKQVRLPV